MSPHNLTQEIGHRLGIDLKLDYAGLARIVVDDDLPIDFEYAESFDQLLMYCTIGTLRAGAGNEEILIELLSANLFGTKSGRCAPAFDDVRSELLFWCAFGSAETVESAYAALEQLVALGKEWRSRIDTMGMRPVAVQAQDVSPFQLA